MKHGVIGDINDPLGIITMLDQLRLNQQWFCPLGGYAGIPAAALMIEKTATSNLYRTHYLARYNSRAIKVPL